VPYSRQKKIVSDDACEVLETTSDASDAVELFFILRARDFGPRELDDDASVLPFFEMRWGAILFTLQKNKSADLQSRQELYTY
jgi:hypothetical protein